MCFSLHWIETQEKQAENPLNDILFKHLRDRIEMDIVRGNRKRMFAKDENIEMQPDTIKAVVGRLEHYDMFGIDEDLNGRLFETFLSATMRGKQLGQFFTPRSIVKLMTKLADLRASRKGIDKVLDACCGTGGFLIEALTDMRNKIREDRSLSDVEREHLMGALANESLFGIDFGKSPFIARIARINMYLHGDGGSCIYYGDGLDKSMEPIRGQDPEVLRNQEELRDLVRDGLKFDVVLTNPPFAMTKELSNPSQARILKEYVLARVERAREKYRQSLRSSAMFLERYCELLRPGGNLLTIIDETILSSDEYDFVRDFIRENFLIRAVISLHGDAFKMAESRVKTSVLYLERKHDPDEQQPATFMYSSVHLGVDNLTTRAKPAKVKQAQELAEKEIEEICAAFGRSQMGKEASGLVEASRLKDRLDVKHCIPLQDRFVSKWRSNGYRVVRLHNIATPVENFIDPNKSPDELFRLLEVSYAGKVQIKETRRGQEITGANMKRVRAGELIMSRYNAIHGATGVVPDGLDGALASGSFLVLECESPANTVYLWSILRTTELRADILSAAVGLGRQTINWDDIRDLWVPLVKCEETKRIASDLLNAWRKQMEAECTLDEVSTILQNKFDVESQESKRRFEGTKPPR